MSRLHSHPDIRKRQTQMRLDLLDFEPQPDDVLASVKAGLVQADKTLPCKLFYDRRGSQLFDQICSLREYYPTRTELQILQSHIAEISDTVGSSAVLVEYGSGSSLKTRTLLRHLDMPQGYVPIDISKQHLQESASSLQEMFTDIPVYPVCADYTEPFHLPEIARDADQCVAWFPGSTIGNFEPADALTFLKSIRHTCGQGSGLLIGVDLKKDPRLLHAAYNDSANITAAFNLNILTRINRELEADFDLSAFSHYALYNVPHGRMEMRLVSLADQTVQLKDGTRVHFAEGESIHTESCYKYTPDSFRALAINAGYQPTKLWIDRERLFSIHYLTS